MTQLTFTPAGPGATRNTASWLIGRPEDLENAYQIDVSWPLTWSDRARENSSANALYLVDGNALFLTATETLRRRQSHRPHETGTVVVAIGYPLTTSVFSPRRSYDLTPPCETYTPPDGPDGRPKIEEHGGADIFLSFITEVVRPFISMTVFPHVSFARTALFGHSYGGLFALHALFTRPASFDVYLAASPSIWWNNGFVLSEAARFCADSDPPPTAGPGTAANSSPILRLSFGSLEESPVRQPDESDEGFELRRRGSAHRRMKGNCTQLYSRLLQSGRLQRVEMREYQDEDHGSVIAPALSGGVGFFCGIRGDGGS
ncbi:Alpha/Beta hydrolase protein [Aspergillus pseudodeflectus]|uniref:Alpha/Beta hydrolase protein n=1 Tax=Aspergillus pseudodeflectus TaxID=176178 RepID=A0ABR4KBS5_9EURO